MKKSNKIATIAGAVTILGGVATFLANSVQVLQFFGIDPKQNEAETESSNVCI